MHRFRAALPPDTSRRLEDVSQEWEEARRAALRILELDSNALRKSIENIETAEAMLWLYEQINDIVAWHQAESKLLKTAAERLLCVLNDSIDEMRDDGPPD
ncbi:hypothetical protein [Thiorhodococcus minor]|uniref:Uncharacterized protein n=1 Tax=Thiorhodococcus minor TaxID=57489 RepID=A0A6M0JYR0_9GAMM|nr:hypothetical protein [Thiorhodococcus minor]NEV62630.1 hypothetical protein [Thiorhodococcus minor]